jgi:predicted HD superfamily hydrolase involved in NAD metabolism
MNFDIEDHISFAQRQLTPQRFNHSLGVMQMMGQLASIYDMDKTAALTSGILHDIAKEFPADELLKLAHENHIGLRSEYDKIPLFLHGPIGACYIARTWGVTDPIVLDAISRHSYFGDGVALAPSFCWCLRLADLMEPSRDWEELRKQLQPVVYAGALGEAAYLLMRWIIPFHEAASLPVHPNMRRVFHELSTLRKEKGLHKVDSLPI